MCQAKRPYQQDLSTGGVAVPVQPEVQRIQARAACHHYASKNCHSGLLVRGRGHALAVDADLQASHLHAELHSVVDRGGSSVQRLQLCTGITVGDKQTSAETDIALFLQ